MSQADKPSVQGLIMERDPREDAIRQCVFALAGAARTLLECELSMKAHRGSSVAYNRRRAEEALSRMGVTWCPQRGWVQAVLPGGAVPLREERLASQSAAEEPHPPSRHCMCAACRPSFDDEARPPQSAAAPPIAPIEQEALSERLKLEAQIHAQEARTANATIAEIYQLVTGATGEPGNWHGAEPVRQAFVRIRAEALEEAAKACDQQVRKTNRVDRFAFEIVTHQCAAAIRALVLPATGQKT